MSQFLDRYLKGEYEEVWADLLDLGSKIREEPLYIDALAVTRETMTRVRYNIELLIDRLANLGYQFGTYRNGQYKVEGYLGPHNPPVADIEMRIINYQRLEGISVIPLSLRIFWEMVGSIDLTGWYPSWPSNSDPLVVFPAEAIESNYYIWRSQVEEGEPDVKFYRVPLAPDYYHKDNVSGGEGYKMQVPNAAIDGFLENEGHDTTFVNYLRLAFRYGGFPGIQADNLSFTDVITKLTDKLMPI
jgi:hypothetical protein